MIDHPRHYGGADNASLARSMTARCSFAHAYRNAIDAGIAKEVARSVLPEGLTVSRLYMAGSLRSWIHYIDLRTGNGTQKEHKLIAEACRDVLAQAFPDIFG